MDPVSDIRGIKNGESLSGASLSIGHHSIRISIPNAANSRWPQVWVVYADAVDGRFLRHGRCRILLDAFRAKRYFTASRLRDLYSGCSWRSRDRDEYVAGPRSMVGPTDMKLADC